MHARPCANRRGRDRDPTQSDCRPPSRQVTVRAGPDVITAPQILPQTLSGNRAFFFDSAYAIVGGCGGFAWPRILGAGGPRTAGQIRKPHENHEFIASVDSELAWKRAAKSAKACRKVLYAGLEPSLANLEIGTTSNDTKAPERTTMRPIQMFQSAHPPEGPDRAWSSPISIVVTWISACPGTGAECGLLYPAGR